jgi:hypothetical protein
MRSRDLVSRREDRDTMWMRMNTRPRRIASGKAAALVGAGVLAVASQTAEARPVATPAITIDSQDRLVALYLEANQADPLDPPSVIEVEQVAPTDGPWVERLSDSAAGDGGAAATGTAHQQSEIADYFIEGEGLTDVTATSNALANAGSAVEIFFTVPIDAEFSFSGTVQVDESGEGSGDIFVALLGVDPDGFPISVFENVSSGFFPAEPIPFFHTGVFQAGSQVQLLVSANAGAGSPSGGGSASASFEFVLDVGDRDKDGLLDKWEEAEGIDVDGDDIVDIPLIGADPDHKDLFVEWDDVSGYGPPSGALNDVVAAFADAPAASVDNPDGLKGVRLHFVDGGDTDSDASTWDNDWARFNAFKDSFFGLPAERALPNWSDYKDARLRSHRYIVFANKNTSGSHSGIAELPGDDCIVYVGAIQNSDPATFRRWVAGTTMHELGHTLNLRHGGFNNTHHKPNYISVMNYSFQFGPKWMVVRNGWKLDYSRDVLPALNETSLNEIDGFGANAPHYAGRMTYWNRNPVTVPVTAVASGAAFLDANPVDLNHSGAHEANARVDLNHLNANWSPSPDQVLEGHDDWSALWYRLSGAASFGAGTSGSGSEVALEISAQEIIGVGESAAPCLADFNIDGDINGADLGLLLAAWGNAEPLYDLNDDGAVDGADLGLLLASWGACD